MAKKFYKWSTTPVPNTIGYGNVHISNSTTTEYGPSSTTNFFSNVLPPEGGYTIYFYESDGAGPMIYTPSNDTNLINIYNHIKGTSHTTSDQVKDAIENDANTFLDGQIERDNLVFSFDSANTNSYSGTGTSWTDLQGNNNVTLQNSPSFSNGVITFDGANDYMEFASNNSVNVHTGFTFWLLWDLPTQSSGAWNYFLYHNPSGNHKYEFGQYGTAANTFHYKDNISYNGTAMTTNMGSGYVSYAFGTTSNGYSFTSVNGADKTIKNPGSNSYWATSPTTPMVFDELFRGAGTSLAANVKKIALYSKELSNTELAYNHNACLNRL